jgi:putative copper export protein
LDETWRLIHLVAAAFWLGGMIFLAVVAVIAARTLDRTEPSDRSSATAVV